MNIEKESAEPGIRPKLHDNKNYKPYALTQKLWAYGSLYNGVDGALIVVFNAHANANVPHSL